MAKLVRSLSESPFEHKSSGFTIIAHLKQIRRNNMDDGIKTIISQIKEFCEFTGELDCLISSEFRIEFVDDIYLAVLNKDSFYARDMLNSEQPLYGLFYISPKNELILYVKRADLINSMGTLYHEITHLSDFINLSRAFGKTDFRKLQDDTFFVLWSEFHADYLMYRYLIDIGKVDIDPIKVVEELKQKMSDYYASEAQLELQVATNFTVRQYGKYMALQNQFPDILDKYLCGFYLNQAFLNVYDYLWEHRNFQSIKDQHDELVQIFKNLEN